MNVLNGATHEAPSMNPATERRPATGAGGVAGGFLVRDVGGFGCQMLPPYVVRVPSFSIDRASSASRQRLASKGTVR